MTSYTLWRSNTFPYSVLNYLVFQPFDLRVPDYMYLMKVIKKNQIQNSILHIMIIHIKIIYTFKLINRIRKQVVILILIRIPIVIWCSRFN